MDRVSSEVAPVDDITAQRMREIQEFLQNNTIPISVQAPHKNEQLPAAKTLAILYHRDRNGQIHYLTMLPRSKHAKATGYSQASVQFPSGGKHAFKEGQWFDVKQRDSLQGCRLESPEQCGLREAIEEVGITLKHVASMQVLNDGVYHSESEKRERPISVVAIELKDMRMESLSEPCKLHGKTEARGWISSAIMHEKKPIINGLVDNVSVARPIREDHIQIVKQLEPMLENKGQHFVPYHQIGSSNGR